MQGTLFGATVFERFLHDRPMSFAICRPTPYCHDKCCATLVFLEQDKGCRISLAVRCCLSRAKGHRAVTDPRHLAHPVPPPPIKSIPKFGQRSGEISGGGSVPHVFECEICMILA